MSDKPFKAAPVRCPSCNMVVKETDLSCFNCGQQLKESSLEEIAAQYRANHIKPKRHSYWVIIPSAIFSVIILIGLIGMNKKGASPSSATIIVTSVFLIYVTLTILACYRSFIAAVIGLSVFAFLTLSVVTSSSNKSGHDTSMMILFIVPLCYAIGIYDLKRKRTNDI